MMAHEAFRRSLGVTDLAERAEGWVSSRHTKPGQTGHMWKCRLEGVAFDRESSGDAPVASFEDTFRAETNV